MFSKILRKFIALVSIFSIFSNLMLPVFSSGIIYAQEASPSPSPEESLSPSPSPSPQPSESPEASLSPSPAPSLTPSDWISSSEDNYETSSEVVTGKEYVASTNDNVKIKFIISGASGKLLASG